MCGFAGFLDPKNRLGQGAEGVAQRMAATLSHRGPDDSGAWADAPAGFSVGHQRLTVIDLSQAGHQPMVSANGRFVLAYNGEIYNFKNLRAELEAAGTRFRGQSDTEVIVEGCAVWGLDKLVPRLNGMFAFALWDREQRVLSLARDRLGIKPLYFGAQNGTFLFGSELKALAAHPDWAPKIDLQAVAALLERGYIPAPLSIYQGIGKLRPGHYASLRAGAEPEATCYWDLARVVADGIEARGQISEQEAMTELEARLRDAVQRRLVADVPLGAFLSGGIDSSLVVSLMQDLSPRPVKTFTIGFEETSFDEAQHAKEVARHLETDHTELVVTGREALDVVPKLARMYDEPFADSSQIPTHLVSALARKSVTVALSGDGGDESFAGYNHFFVAQSLGRKLERVPGFARLLLAAAARAVDRSGLAVAAGAPNGQKTVRRGRDRWQRAEGLLHANGFPGIYRKVLCHWPDPERVAGLIAPPAGDPFVLAPPPGDRLDRMQHTDLKVYLPDDILTKVDRASMAVSLEARVPLLDHRVVEWAWRLPQHLKVRDGTRKWALRQILYKHVPPALIERPKCGFSVPVGHWIQGPLREWAEDLLSERNLEDGGCLDPAAVRARWRDHLAGRADWTASLWDVLMFEAWRRDGGLSGS
jgi:asparagine synthase (glutamine-hydrolysing)